MAELVSSGSRKISELTLVSGISGSTAIPIVMGGNTVQISHSDFLTSTVFSQPNTFTEVNEFTIEQRIINNGSVTDLTGDGIIIREDIVSGPPTYGFRISSSMEEILFQDIVTPIIGNPFNTFLKIATNADDISILRNTSIDGNLIVSGGITAELINVNLVSSSIVYSSGSNIFGNTVSNTHQFTGSLRVTGSANVIGGFTQTSGVVSFGGAATFNNAISTFNQGVNIFQTASFFGPVNIGTSPQTRNLLHFGNYNHTGNTIQTGSISVNGNVIASSFTGSLDYTNLNNIPNGIVSSSSQVSFDGIVDKPTLVSGSSQIDLTGTTNYESGIKARLNAETVVSSSQQIKTLLPNGTVSGSSQVSFDGIVDKPTLVSGSSQIEYSDVRNIPNGIVSSSTQINQYNIFATTGSNGFVGNQNINGDVIVTGSLIVSGSNTFRNIGRAEFTGSVSVDGDMTVTQSITASFFTGSFVGDGSSLSGVSAGDVDFTNILNKPTLVSGSSQIDLTGTTNYVSGIKDRLNAETVVSSSQQILDYGVFVTTGSNTFVGNQIVTGSLRISGSVIQIGETDGNIIIESGSISLGSSRAFGGNSIAVGKALIVESAPFSIAVGFGLRTEYDSTALFGAYNTASNAGQTIIGVASKLDNSIGQGAFVIGNGTDVDNRSNLLVAQGNVVQISGSLQISGSISQVGIGTNNTIIGRGAGSPTGAGINTLVGVEAGKDITVGFRNTFFGAGAGQLTSVGNSNTYVGQSAGNGNTSGSANIAVGRFAGARLLDGTTPTTNVGNSIFIGNFTESDGDNIFNQIVIGDSAEGGGQNTVTLGNNSIVSTRLKGSVTASIFTGSFVGDGSGLTGIPGITPIETGSFATTGSNTFIGNQTISGSLTVSGSSTFTNIGLAQFTGSFNITGSSNLTGSVVINQLTYPTPNFADGQYGVEVPTLGVNNVFELEIPRTIYEYVKNDSGTTLLKGTPVHSVGASGFNTLVIAASASNAATMPATFILAQDLDSEEEGLGIAIGVIQGINTTGLIAGDPVWVGANGGFTQTKPTGSNLIQNLGIVTRVGVNGGGVVLGAGRSNDVPNIEEGYFWVGNSGSVATPTPTSSFAVTSSANTFYGNQTITGSLNVTGSLEVNNDVKIQNGYVILTNVSQSLEFVDDTAAAAGGVPLGGLYRSGNFILIRIV